MLQSNLGVLSAYPLAERSNDKYEEFEWLTDFCLIHDLHLATHKSEFALLKYVRHKLAGEVCFWFRFNIAFAVTYPIRFSTCHSQTQKGLSMLVQLHFA